MIDGFMERADRVGALLEDPATTFLIVTSPRHDPVEEAIHFHRKLADAAMPFGGLVVNRVHVAPAGRRPAAGWPPTLGDDLARPRRRVARTSWPRSPRATRRASSTSSTELGDPPAIVVPELDDDVHDVDGLAQSCAAPVAGRVERVDRLGLLGQQLVGDAAQLRARGARRARRAASPAGSRRARRSAPRRRAPAARGRRPRRARARSRRGSALRLRAGPRARRRSRPSARPRPRSPAGRDRRAARGRRAASPSAPRRRSRARSRARSGAAPTRARPRAACGARRASRTRAARPPPRRRAGSRPAGGGSRSRAATAHQALPSVRAQAVGPSAGSASSHRRSAVCSRRSRRPASSSARWSPARPRARAARRSPSRRGRCRRARP